MCKITPHPDEATTLGNRTDESNRFYRIARARERVTNALAEILGAASGAA